MRTANPLLLPFREEQNLVLLIEEYHLIIGKEINNYRSEFIESVKWGTRKGWEFSSGRGYNALSHRNGTEYQEVRGRTIVDLIRKTGAQGLCFQESQMVWVDDQSTAFNNTLVHEFLHAYEDYFFEYSTYGDEEFQHGIKHSEIERESQIIVEDRPDIPELIMSFR